MAYLSGPSRNWPGRLRRFPSWILLASALLPIMAWFIKRLDDGSDEPLGLAALALALLLAWRDGKSLRVSANARTIGVLVLLLSVTTIGILPPMIRAMFGIAGIATWFGLHRKPGIMGLLFMSLPVIASLQFYAGYPMRLATAGGTVELLAQFGLVATRKGVGIEFGGMTIGVDPACSGIRMLWHALTAAMALAAIHRTTWRTTMAGGILALFLVIPANIMRAACLALLESGRFNCSLAGHGEIGLICFCVVLIPLWWLMSKHAHPAGKSRVTGAPPRLHHQLILLASALLAPAMMIRTAMAEPPPSLTMTAPASFTFNGLTLPLHPLPSSPEESAFSKSFPGTISSHQWGDDQVILRRVTLATRRLHPSRDCLRAAGYETTDSVVVKTQDGAEWSRFSASGENSILTIHERIVSEQDGSSWTDVPTWYWSALRHPLNGPWRAETLISK